MRAIFYIDSERLVGHALSASKALMSHMPELEMTFWVYGTADKDILAKNNIAFERFLPQQPLFNGIVTLPDGTHSSTEMAHKDYRPHTIGGMIKSGLARGNASNNFAQRAIILTGILFGLAIILLYQIAHRTAKFLGHMITYIGAFIRSIYRLLARVINALFNGISLTFVALLRGAQNVTLFLLRCTLGTAKFLSYARKNWRLIYTDFSRVMRLTGSKILHGVKLVIYAPLLLALFLMRGLVRTVELIFQAVRRSTLAASIFMTRISEKLTRTKLSIQTTLSARIAWSPLRAILKLTNLIIGPFVFANRIIGRILVAVSRSCGRGLDMGRRWSISTKRLQNLMSMRAKTAPYHPRSDDKTKPTGALIEKLNKRERELPEKFNTMVTKFYVAKNNLSFQTVKKRDELFYNIRHKFLVRRNKFKADLLSFINKTPPNNYLTFIKVHNNGFDRMIYTSKPDVVFLLENNVETTTHLLTTRLKGSGIKSVVVPFTIPNPVEAAQFYKTDKSRLIRGPISALIGAVFPHWKFDYAGKKMLRMTKSKVLTFETLGLTLDMPWYPNSGPVDKIFVESPAMQRIYERLNFPNEQLACVGDAVASTLQTLRKKRAEIMHDFLKGHALKPGLPVILCAFPPNQYGDKNKGFEYDSFDALIEGWAGMLNTLSQKANIIIRPHPRVTPEMLRDYCNDDIIISAVPTAELVPLCDIYLACISATIRWALSIGIPVVNYDCYRYRYDDYEASDAIIDVETQAECMTALHDMIVNFSMFQALETRAQSDSHNWGQKNGTFGANMADVIRAL